MSFFDDFLPSIPIIGPAVNSIFGGNAPGGDTALQDFQRWQDLIGQLPQYNEPSVQAAFRGAETAAGNFARGEREAGLQQARSQVGGGAATSGAEVAGLMGSGQGAANRLNM